MAKVLCNTKRVDVSYGIRFTINEIYKDRSSINITAEVLQNDMPTEVFDNIIVFLKDELIIRDIVKLKID